MNRLFHHKLSAGIFRKDLRRKYSVGKGFPEKSIQLPDKVDVVIIGGGSTGCNTLYHLAKQGVKAVLLERSKLTAGTTWHTAGLLWRLRPSDIDIHLLNRTRDVLLDIKKNTEYDPGWLQTGGLFIARKRTRIDEYKRLSTIGRAMGIENDILSVDETQSIFPLLNSKSYLAALYSPGDGVIDPTMLCNALTKLAIQTSNAQVYEDCQVQEILTEPNVKGVQKIVGVRTKYGDIKTDCVVNATGVWGKDLIEPFGITLPLIPMQHSYVVTESIEGIKGMPNVRDHDASIYFRIQGESVCLGGYERNPIILDSVARDFNFGLYDLDWSTFDNHIKTAEQLCPAMVTAGIKSTISGPEAFTPDHKPIMGPDPRLIGLFHSCGFNSAGMMFGSGCAEQLVEWIVNGRPEVDMHNFDVRRFTPKQMTDRNYATERTHEAYGDNYAMVFNHTQPLAGRNFQKSPLHDELVLNGAVMEEKHGYERPSFFFKEKAPVVIPPYDWYGTNGHALHPDKGYLNILRGDETYGFSEYHYRIASEALSCRNAAAMFDLSSFCKILIEGSDAKNALSWICTNDIDKPPKSIINTCALNNRGGVEAQFSVNILEKNDEFIRNSRHMGDAYYIVADGANSYHILSHLNETVAEKGFDVTIKDLTNQIGIISIQGPKSRSIFEELTGINLTEESLPLGQSMKIDLNDANRRDSFTVRIMRTSLVGELGYELHVKNEYSTRLYNKMINIGSNHGLKDAGFRALYSLSCEKGIHRWGYDLRSDDTPIEGNLEMLCRKNGAYNGIQIVENQLKEGVTKSLVYFTLDDEIPLHGLEGVYRNDVAVGHLRRADFGYFLNKSIGKSYIRRNDGKPIDMDYLKKGSYQIDIMGKMYPAKIHIQSPFDPTNLRPNGHYNEIPENLI